jgi:hypothetical protein
MRHAKKDRTRFLALVRRSSVYHVSIVGAWLGVMRAIVMRSEEPQIYDVVLGRSELSLELYLQRLQGKSEV